MGRGRIVIGIVCMLCGLFSSYASKECGLSADSIASRIMYQVWSYPQEKVYVMTDRDAYVAGDTIRFRAFLVDAATHRHPYMPSKFIYAEVIDPFGKTVKRVKIKDQNDAFAGILPLDEELPEGSYTFAAYTKFMENQGKEYFFRKSMPIFSQMSRKYRIESDNENERLTVRLKEIGSDRLTRAERISITGPNEESYSGDVKKRSSYSMKISDSMREAGFIKVKFDRYEKFIYIPDYTEDISLSFHPEGGYLIPGLPNRLAFKSIGKNGLSRDFKGFILDEADSVIDTISTSHMGMGVFEFTPQHGKSYKAVVGDKSFYLPESQDEASVIRIDEEGNDNILVSIKGRKTPDMALIAHNGGVVTFAENPDSTATLKIDRKILGVGIIQFLLVNGDGDILSSRMMFNHRGYILNDSDESLPEGDYAVRAFRDTIPEHSTSIVSGLLLQGDLKGHVENPDYYFINRDSIKDANLDILLLTQGWERYDLKSAIKQKYTVPDIPLEIGGEISGTVKSRWRAKPLSDAIVMLLAPEINFGSQAITDSEGRFVFNGFDWPDDTPFFIQVFGESGSKEHNYIVDEDTFPVSETLTEQTSDYNPKVFEDVLALASGTILLEEIVVTAPMTPEESKCEMQRALGVRSFTSDDFDNLHATTYEDVIRRIPGIRIVNGNVVSMRPRGTYNTGAGGSPVELWIDGTKWNPTFSLSSGGLAQSGDPEPVGDPFRAEHTYKEYSNNTLNEFASMYPFDVIKSVEYYPPATALLISMSAAHKGGALLFTTKDGSEIKDANHDLFIREFKRLGYTNAPEAYKPHYIYDLTTDDKLYRHVWIPIVKDAKSLTVFKGLNKEIEGISKDGLLVTIRTCSK